MLKKIQKIILFILVVYTVLGFFVLPYVLKPKIIEIVEQKTNAKISIENISFNPFIFKLRISGIKLTTLDDKDLVSLKSLLVNIEPYSLAFSAVHISEFILEEPEISLVYKEDKSFNFSEIIKQTNEAAQDDDKTKKSTLPRIILDRVAIENGAVNYEDFTHPSKFDFSFNKIGFELNDIDTNDFNASDAKLRFYSSLDDGGFVDLKTDIVGFKPLILKGSLDFEASKLYTQWRYMKDSLNLEVADGKLSFNTKYYFNMDDLNATSIYNLNAALDNLRVKPTDKYKDVLNLGSFYIQEATIKPIIKDVHVKKIGLDSLYVKVSRDSDGKIDWLDYIKTKKQDDIEQADSVEQNNSAAKEESSGMWKVIVDDIALQKIKTDFYDKGISPQVDTRLDELNLYVQNVTLEGAEPLLYQMDMRLNEKFKCSSRGELIHKKLLLESYSKCTGFDIVHYRPYIDKAAKDALEVYDLELQTAEAAFDANVTVKDVASEIVVSVNDANFNLNDFALNKGSTKEGLVSFRSFDINGIGVNTKTKDVSIDKVKLSKLDIKSGRYKDGRLNITDLVVPHAKKKVTSSAKKAAVKSTKEEKSYRLVLNHLALKSARVTFTDKVLDPAVTSTLDRINFNAYNIDSKQNSWLKYDLALRVNGKGSANSKGRVRHTPLKQEGTFEIKKVSLTELTPYIQEKAFASIDDGYMNFKSKIKYAKSRKKPDLKVEGSLSFKSVFVSDSRDSSSLLSFSNLGLNSFTLEMFPNRLFIDELNLDSFYVNALIDRQKNMNLASLAKPKQEVAVVEKAHINKNSAKTETQFPVKIMKLDVSDGSAKFGDLSLPIPFRTNIHDLNGVVYAISNVSGETSYVDIKGEVDRYGSTELKGSVNAGNPKEYMDLAFNFRNLDLSSVSGYSASFAGHEIAGGKLFLDLGYKILDSELLSQNSIVIKNIKLGAEVEDENISSLPLGFVIALLEDPEGIIDIDMPIEGNVDAPDFKYGALVLKTFGNMIVQAVTSPFRFLGSMMGMDGEALEYAEFESGLSKLVSSEQEKLDNIAKIMVKRPKILLSIAPMYDELADRNALQGQKLAAMVVQMSGIKNKEDHESAMTIDLLEDIYESFKDDDKLSKIKDDLKTKYKDDTLDRAYLSALIKECKEVQPVSHEELKSLATSRANALKSYLVDDKNINTQRIKILETDRVKAENEKWVRSKLKIEVE